MKESKKLLRSLKKAADKEKVKKVQIPMKKKYRVAILSKYGSVEGFERVVEDLHKEVVNSSR